MCQTPGHNGAPKGRTRLRIDRMAQQHKGLCEGDCGERNDFYKQVINADFTNYFIKIENILNYFF